MRISKEQHHNLREDLLQYSTGWGKMRAWGNHMVHHALYQKQNYSYAGIVETLSGAPFDVRFISFDDIKTNPAVLDDIDVIINVGGAYTAHSGGAALGG